MSDLDVAFPTWWEAQKRRSGVDLRKHIGSSLGVVTLMNSSPRWESQNGRSTCELALEKDGGESLRLTQALCCLGS